VANLRTLELPVTKITHAERVNEEAVTCLTFVEVESKALVSA
jgi:hypothetical protein